MKKTGDHIHTDRFELNRRNFLQLMLGGSTAFATALSCNNSRKKISGSIVGASSSTGHLLWNTAKLPRPVKEVRTDILIVGGGITGLSAKRWLHKKGIRNVLMTEMDKSVGGNAASGQNSTSAYPWGAHYLPIPNLHNTELLDFLQEHGIITGFANGLPAYNEYYLCQDPEERLLINGYWQEGLIPHTGISANDKQQVKRFLDEMEQYKTAIGNDGKEAFTIPLIHASADERFVALDNISFSSYLKNNGYTSPYLLWYLEYCCKDDYGCNLDTTSAWAGIHYFAARKGKASNAEPSAILTWPQGNGFLVKQLRKDCSDGVLPCSLAYQVDHDGDAVTVLVYDTVKKESTKIIAGKVLLATPQYVTNKILRRPSNPDFQYAPWVVANITINGLPDQNGLPLCWDNVIYGTESVGYVNANHQDVERKNKRVLTFYLPFTQQQPADARHALYKTTYEDLQKKIVAELNYAHPGIRDYIEHMDIWIWGHGMIAPQPGFIWGDVRKAAAQPVNNRIFFAHSDLGGISIFEEAFYQGIRAAEAMIQTT